MIINPAHDRHASNRIPWFWKSDFNGKVEVLTHYWMGWWFYIHCEEYYKLGVNISVI